MRFLNILNPKAHEGNRLLRRLNAELSQAKIDYKSYAHSGHPEEQLQLIDDRHYWVSRVKAAKARGWTIDRGSEYSTKAALHDWPSRIEPGFRGSAQLKANITAGFLIRIEWAEKGLI